MLSVFSIAVDPAITMAQLIRDAKASACNLRERIADRAGQRKVRRCAAEFSSDIDYHCSRPPSVR